MKFNILTLFPQLFKPFLEHGVFAKAQKKGLIQCSLIPIREFSKNPFHSVDDRPFGGGDGMVLSYEPLESAIQSLSKKGHVVYLSPQGKPWSFKHARFYSENYKTLTLVCGRYAGVDARWIQQYADEEISIGDYILSGGEAAAIVLMDSMARFIPGVLGSPDSAQNETFEHDLLLEPPQWTRPKTIKGYKIPDVFFSGHHEKIQKARYYLSLLRTLRLRPRLLENSPHKAHLLDAQKWFKTLSPEEKKACLLDSMS